MTSGTDQAGAAFQVSLRELARDLGLAHVWRKWTLEAWVEEITALAGHPDLRPTMASEPDLQTGFASRGPFFGMAGSIVEVRAARQDLWVLVETTPARRKAARGWPPPGMRMTTGVVAQGLYFPCVMVLLHHLLEASGVDSQGTAALSTRLLATGVVRLRDVRPLCS